MVVQMPQVLKEEVRNSILNAAVKIFREKDYNKSSMNAIAVEAGISVGNIYRYFKNKEELFDVIVKDLAEKIMSVMDRCKCGDSIDEVFVLLKDCIGDFIDLYSTNEDVFIILIKATDQVKTKYNVEKAMIEYMSKNLNEIATNFCKKNDMTDEDLDNLCMTLSTALTKGVNYIILSNGPVEDMKRRLFNYLDFMRIGFIENVKLH